MNPILSLSPIGRAALQSREGRRLKAYRDKVGVLTIGCGHTSAAGAPLVTPSMTITSAQCDAIFAHDVEAYATRLSLHVKVPVTQNQADAMISIFYNVEDFGTSTAIKKLNAGDLAGAAEAILMWRKPASIIDRRLGEYDQFCVPYGVALPKARRSDAKPVSGVAAVIPPPLDGAKASVPQVIAKQAAAGAPAIEPVHLPPTWLERFGGWVDRVFGPSAYPLPDVATRG